MDFPPVYICTLNWNQFEHTSECLDSLMCIDYPNYRVIVVDNGSSDGSAAELKRKYPHVDFIENGENLGFAAGNNVGIRYALKRGADYVFLINNDAVVDPLVLERLVTVAKSDKRTGIVGPAIYCYPESRVFWAAGMEKIVPKGKIFPHYVMRGKGEVDTGQYRQNEDVDMINACALMIKREVVEKIGLLDEKFFAYNEDSDWNERAGAAGYRIVYVPGAMVWHKGSVSLGGEGSPSSWFYTVRNELFFLKKRIKRAELPGIYIDYLRENFWFWKGFKHKGDNKSAKAVLDGVWSALIDKGGEYSRSAPRWFEKLFQWKMYMDKRRTRPIAQT